MNKVEFNKTLKEFGINDYLMKDTDEGIVKPVYSWCNTEIYFCEGDYEDVGYDVVNNKVPLEVANAIYEKNNNNCPGISFITSAVDEYGIPIKYATDDQYEKEVKEHINNPGARDVDLFYAKLKKSKRNMLRRKDENKYIRYGCDVYSIEGFVIFLTELKDYYARKVGLPETEVQRYNEILLTINARILMETNPTITTYDWMSEADIFLDTIARDNNTPFGHVFRKVIDQFDKTINPYINEDVELDSFYNYSQKVNISAKSHNRLGENCCKVVIKAKDGTGEVSYSRMPNGFSYQLTYVLGPEEYLTILHCFDGDKEEESDRGEQIYINYFGEGSVQQIDLRYNITKELSGKIGKEKTPITAEQKIFVYNELVKATNLASTITIDNMQKNVFKKS